MNSYPAQIRSGVVIGGWWTDGKGIFTTPGKLSEFLRRRGYLPQLQNIPRLRVIGVLGFLWLAFDRKRQGWHDKIAGTYVIYADEDGFSNSATLEFEPTDQGKGWIWLVLWFVVALVMPAALLSSLFLLGSALRSVVTNVLQSFL